MRTNASSPRTLFALGLVLAATSTTVDAQRPPLSGTVNPRAVAPPLQQPAPIGGIRTVPIGAPIPDALHRRPHHRIPGGIVPLRVIDAPLVRGGAVVFRGNVEDNVGRWFLSAERPVWRVDTLAPKVDAWRDIIVEDVLCTYAGTCLERITRMRARWSPLCNCYRFADALGRIWRVE